MSAPAPTPKRPNLRSRPLSTTREGARIGNEKTPPERGFHPSGRRDLNSGPLVPQTSALTRLRHAPSRD